MTDLSYTRADSLGPSSIRPINRRVFVRYGSFTLVNTNEAMLFHEHGREPVVFVPRRHLPAEFLPDGGHLGTLRAGRAARYWDFSVGGQTAENGIWCFERSQDELTGLAGYVAFDPAQVVLEIEGAGPEVAERAGFDSAKPARGANLPGE